MSGSEMPRSERQNEPRSEWSAEQEIPLAAGVDGEAAGARWFAVWTRSRQEKVSASMLETLGVEHFLPLKSERRQWSDRLQTVTVPLFSGYVFVRVSLPSEDKLRVLKVPGIAGFVGNSRGPLPIPDSQVEAVRAVVERGIDCTVHPLLEEGDRVRVVHGALAGVEGRLTRIGSGARLLISIELIHRSMSVSIARGDVVPIAERVA